MSKDNTLKNSKTADVFNDKDVRGKQFVYNGTIVDISEKVTDSFHYEQAEKFDDVVNSQEYMAVQRDLMTVMSNSMSASDFQKMQEEGFDISSMEPEQVVTILDKIKTALAQAGTHIQGYNDNLSVDKITEITGNTGYAETIAKELSYADVPVTEENMEEIDKVVEQALTQKAPEESSIVYLISHGMKPTLANLYKAEFSGVQVKRSPQMTGYASNGYSRQGTDVAQIRKTNISEEDYQQIEKQIKSRIQADGLEVNQQTMENGKWLLEKGLPVTGENIELLQEIKDISFPLELKKIIKQSANAIGEGRSPFLINPAGKDISVYEEAANLFDRYQKITFQAVDYTVNHQKECNLKNMEAYDAGFGYSVPQLEARKTLEEVRLKMTVEANVKLLKSGFHIETASMEELIKQLDRATKSLNETVFGSQDSSRKAEIYSQTRSFLKELPGLPISVVGKIPYMEKATISNVVEEGRLLQKQYEDVRDSYETIMTAPRADLGDSIRKAFRNVDDILQDMNLEVNESNRRAIRIMGYNQITITEENLDKIKEADRQVRNVMENLKPGMTLAMIREGRNPLEMSMKELQDYIQERERDFVNDTQKFSEFLYKLDKKNNITKAEREAYIGVYRLFRQIEKSDGAVIGSLVNQNAEMNLSNLLSSVRSRKAKHTDIKVDDLVGVATQVNRKGVSISEQIEKGIAEVKNALSTPELEKTPDEVLKDIQNLVQDEKLKKAVLEQQLQEIRDGVSFEGKEKDYLEIYRQPVTLDALRSVMVLNEKRGSTFKKSIELEQGLTEQNISEKEENILNKAQEFLSVMEKEELREDSYNGIILHTRQILEETLEQNKLDYTDIKELQSIYKQVSVASSLSKEENYEIPMQLGEEITSINLKIVHGTSEKGEVRITMDTEKFGKVEARFIETPNGLEGSVLTDYMDGKEILEKNSDRLQDAINEALQETKTELKGLFFGVNEKLDINTLEGRQREEKTNLSLLYKVAKEFIYYVKEV